MRWNGLSIHARKAWGARAARDEDRAPVTRDKSLFVHYSAGRGMSIDTWKEQVACMQAMQNFHMDDPDRRWNDIAYNFVVFQPYGRLRLARIFQGRPLGVMPASQQGHNDNPSVCVVAAPGEPIKRATVRRLKSIYKRVPCQSLKGHRDVSSSPCPGDLLYKALPEIRKAK